MHYLTDEFKEYVLNVEIRNAFSDVKRYLELCDTLDVTVPESMYELMTAELLGCNVYRFMNIRVNEVKKAVKEFLMYEGYE